MSVRTLRPGVALVVPTPGGDLLILTNVGGVVEVRRVEV